MQREACGPVVASDSVSDATCIDPLALAAICSEKVATADPYPWCQTQDLIREPVYQRLLEELPHLGAFKNIQGKRRRYGQTSHDRFVLDYAPGTPLSLSWQQLIDELYEGPYPAKVAELLGRDDYFLTCHWHYTPSGCSVSPHCDAVWKLGSHIFYFNDPTEWDPGWGGETLVLDDGGAISYASAPGFDDFRGRFGCGPTGNQTLLFLRTDHSWHGVEPLRCPEGAMRRVFIVEFRKDSLRERFRAGARLW